MSWRSNAQRTGMNAQPLGTVRRWGGGASSSENPPPASASSSSSFTAHAPSPSPRDAAAAVAAQVAASIGIKRDRDDAPSASNGAANVEGVPRKRRSRWGDASEKVDIPTAIGANVSKEELDKYAIQVRLDEISRKLRSNDFIPADRERSPSPPPTYDGQGRRTNTREVRYRKKLEDERVTLVERQMKLDPNFRPPAEYHATKRNQRPMEKVYLPIKDFPQINFFGLLVGPRGNTLKKMERESGAKISIRGRGSIKEGKGKGAEEDEEEMHCVVTGDDDASVKKCIRHILLVIETAASTPEGENDHKRSQLRELAALNGTLRDDENQVCKNCGNKGHRAFECPEQRNWTAHIICHRCGGQGHLARDCTQGRGASSVPLSSSTASLPGGPGSIGNRQFDSEYANLMAELGETGGGNSNLSGGPSANDPANDGKPIEKIAPWRNPEVWTSPGFGNHRLVGGGHGVGGGHRFAVTNGGWNNGQGGPPNPNAGGGATGGGWNQRGNGYGLRMGGGGYQQQQQQGGYPGASHHHQQQQQQYGQQAGGYTADPSAQQQQDYSAEWAAYYAAQQATATTATATVTTEDQPQQDYTKEWEEYYRQQAAATATATTVQAGEPVDPSGTVPY